MDGDLLFSDEAAVTRYLFYQGLNGVNLFIEDSDREYEYETIFKRLLGDNYIISAIFAVGGKSNMIARFNELGESTEGIANYYLVDGDFDRILRPSEMINNSHFIYLERYNIESYFLDKTACERFAKGKLKCFDLTVEQSIQFDSWKSRIISQSAKLFFCYCYIQKYDPQQENVSRSPYKFIDQKTGFERTDGAFMKYWNELSYLDPNIQRKVDSIKQVYRSLYGDDYTNLICGKFLLTSLFCYLRSIFQRTFTVDELRWYLIEHFDISCLNFVKNVILINQTT